MTARAGEPTTEYRAEMEQGFLRDRASGEVTAVDGLRIRWRFDGERRWRKVFLVPDEETGQTVGTLLDDASTIVAVLAEKACSRG